MQVIVASLNPVKLEAVRLALVTFDISDCRITGVEVNSGVPDQPMTDMETLSGARNRVIQIRREFPDAELWIGIEGGIEPRNDHLEAFAWVYAAWPSGVNRGEGTGQSRTTSFQLPHKVSRLIEEGFELGAANDQVFCQHNSKQKGGALGLLTHNKITRTQLYRQAVELALIPYVNSDLYNR